MKRILLSTLLVLGVGYAATLPYQGLATDAKGNPQADASYQVDFALYSSATAVTPLWSESQKLTTRKGLFSTKLGSDIEIPDSLFKGIPLYLGVSFGGGSEGGRALLGMTPWAKRALVSDTAKVTLGMKDSVTALRSALAGQASTISALSAAVTAQGTQITTKDSVRASHMADSAKVAVGLKDSVIAVRSALRDTSASLRTKANADSLALAKSVKDSTKALRDTVTSLRTTIAGLNTTLSSQSATLSSQAVTIKNQSNSLTSLLSMLNSSVSWQSGIAYGTLVDSRDGQVYRTVAIGTQTWMAQNLNYRNATGSSDTVGVCYSNSADNCAKYGRLYTWAQVMNGSSSSASSPSGVQGICPTGWHVPSDAEWTTMQTYVDASNTADGTKLKSTSGWSINTGTDTYGFRALPGGYVYGASFYVVGNYGYWWSATEYTASLAWNRLMDVGYADVYRSYGNKAHGFSLRCVKD